MPRYRGSFNLLAGIMASIVAFLSLVFGGHVAHTTPTTQTVVVTSTQPSHATTLAVSNIKNTPVLARSDIVPQTAAYVPPAPTGFVLGTQTSPIDTITHGELNTALNQLDNSLRSQFLSISASALSFSGGPASTPANFQAIASSQRVDQLSGTKLSNITVNGVTGLTASDIPSLTGSYFPATSTIALTYGGTGTSTTPTYGKLLVGNSRGTYDLLATSSLGITGGGGGSVGSGTQGQLAFYNAAGTTLTATSSLFLAQSGNVGIGTTSPTSTLTVSGTLSLNDNSASSSAVIGSELTTDGDFTTDPSSSWTLGSGWTWDSSNHRASYAGSGAPINSLTIDSGGAGYTNGDVITISGDSGDATYTATAAGGKVTGLTASSTGTAYTTRSGVATTGGTGTGLVVSIRSLTTNGATLSQTISLTTGPYLVTFTIQNYSGVGGVKFTGYYGQFSINYTSNSEFDRANGTYSLVVAATTTTLSFTPTADFNGAITNVSMKSIPSTKAVETINNTDSTTGIELRPGGANLYNTFVGTFAGQSNTSGIQNTGVGYEALAANTTGYYNTAIGLAALADNTTGNQNSGLGYGALAFNTSGTRNTASGIFALLYNTTGSSNTASGYNSIGNSISGSSNSGYGDGSLNGVLTGNLNTGIGKDVMYGNFAGSGNSALGADGLFGVHGSDNTGIGYFTGKNSSSGSFNILIGANIDMPSNSASQQLNIGNVLYGTGMYNGAAGSGAPVSAGKIAIGTSTPYARLTVWGSDTLATTSAFTVANSASTSILTVNDDGSVGIKNASPAAPLDVAGDTLLSGTSRHLNFNFGTGDAGYGIRDNAGTMEFKNSSGAWTALGNGATNLGTAVSYVKSLDTNLSEVVDSNSGATTTVYTYPVQAGALGSNKILRVAVSGYYYNSSGSNKTLGLTLLYGGVVVASRTSATITTSPTSGGWNAVFYLAATSTGAQIGSFLANVSNGAASVAPWGATGVSSVDSTQAQNLVIQVTNSAAASSTITTKESAETEMLNATDTFGSQWTTNGATISYATTSGKVGIGTTTPYAPLEVWGSDAASSTLTFNVVNNASTTVFAVFDGGNAQLSGTLTQSSDQRLKTNIQSLDASTTLGLIAELNPVTFNWLDPLQDSTLQVGFIAQDVQKIFPQLISTTSATALTPGGTLGLNYIGLIAPIVKAIQALATKLASLEQTVAGFAESFTTKMFTANEADVGKLCVTDAKGKTCITRAQLDTVLLGQSGQSSSNNQSSIQISGSTSFTITNSSTTPPTVAINGNNPATLQVGDSYTDLGVTAKDSQGHDLGYKTFINGTLANNITIDTTKTATDTIDYVAVDTWGNTATGTRMVIVQTPATAPTIETPVQNASTTATSSTPTPSIPKVQ